MQYKLRNGMLDITLFSSLNLSKSCVVCTFEFLISPSRRHSTYRSTTSGYHHGWLADRTLTAGVPGRRFIKDLMENSMVPFNFTVTFEECVALVFGSWFFVTDGASNFHCHHMDTIKLEASAPISQHVIDEFVDELNEIPLLTQQSFTCISL